jgi:hypothetical protein
VNKSAPGSERLGEPRAFSGGGANEKPRGVRYAFSKKN